MDRRRVAMPMLASTLIWRPSISSGSASALCSRWATLEASVGSWTLCRITPNSSPPRRAAVSPVRMTDSSWSASVWRAASPAWMPEPVVDALEVVEVDEQEGRLPAGPLAGRDGMVEPLGEMDTVRKTGQRVVERLATELFLRFALGRDVEQIALQMERLSVLVRDDHALVSNPDPAAVTGAQAVLDAQRLVRPVRPGVSGEDAVAVFGMQKLDEEQLVGMPVRDRVAEDVLDLTAGEDVRADSVEGVGIDDKRKLFHERAIPPVDLAALGSFTRRRSESSFALEHDARDPCRHVDQLEVALGRTSDGAVVERERPDHLLQRRRRSASTSRHAAHARERARGTPPRADRWRCLRRRPSSCEAAAVPQEPAPSADRHSVDRGAVVARQARRDEGPQRPRLGLHQEHRSDRLGHVGLDQARRAARGPRRVSTPEAALTSSSRCICRSAGTRSGSVTRSAPQDPQWLSSVPSRAAGIPHPGDARR